MKILVDARELHYRRAGIGRYIYNLFHGIQELEQEIEFGSIIKEGEAGALPDILRNERLEIPPGVIDKLKKPFWDNVRIPRFMQERDYDLFYAAGHFAPVLRKNVPFVATIHDLTPFVFPGAFPLRIRSYLKYNIRKIAEKARFISVPSENTKKDMINLLRTDGEKIRVVYPSLVPTEFRSDPKRNPIKIDKYILSVGTNEPRKNLKGLIKAYALLDKDLRKEYPLVITGRAGWMAQNLDSLIRESGIEREVIFTGFIEEPMLPHLFGHADVFCYPSLYEGFGFPPLEAMHYGAPVLTSNVASLPEVVGDAGILVDPHSEEAIAEGLTKLLTSESLRWELRDEGRVQAQKFINNNFALQMIEMFHESL